jgi:hypothetical protein
MRYRESTILAATLITIAACSTPVPHVAEGASLLSDEIYHNPADNKTYVARGGWKTYEPDHSDVDLAEKKVKIESVRLLMSEHDIAAQTTVEELASFTRQAERLAEETFSKNNNLFKVLVQFECTPSSHEVLLAYQGEAAQELLQRYYSALKAAKRLPVKSDKVVFQLELLVQ